MEFIAIPILLAMILGFVQYFGENIYKGCGRYYKHVISFSAGVAITYLFLELFPQALYDAPHACQDCFQWLTLWI